MRAPRLPPVLAFLLLAGCAHLEVLPAPAQPPPPAARPALVIEFDARPEPAPPVAVEPSPVPPTPVASAQSVKWGPPEVEARLKQMTLEQKVGQLMMVGFGGQVVDEKIEELVRGKQEGAICMF